MLLSRFWYVVLALAFGGATFTLYVAAQMYNHAGRIAMADALTADSSAVDWYLRDDSRRRSSELVRVALSSDIANGLATASGTDDIKQIRKAREPIQKALRTIADKLDPKFDIVWAVDANGRVMASFGFDHRPDDWELGGYPVVADALHGWIRDDAWVWRGRIYRIVARPVENVAGGEPVGAVIGAKIVDDVFARSVSMRTNSAVGFYAEGQRVASGAPEGFDKANLDQITSDLKLLDANKDYQEKGRSEVRVIGEHLGVVYARLPGEAWELGAGYAVGRLAVGVGGPLDFLNQADNNDKKNVPTALIALAILATAAAGLAFSFLEHTQPLTVFRKEAERLAKGEIDALAPSRFRGAYKKIAADLNDGIDKAAAKGGAPRKAADLEQVLGPLPQQPQMSAFSVPGSEPTSDARPSAPSVPSAPRSLPSLPKPRISQGNLPAAHDEPATSAPRPPAASGPKHPPGPPPAAAPPHPPAPPRPKQAEAEAGADEAAPFDELTDWQHVFEEFVSVKKQCGEPTETLTFEKFKGTLQRNKDALVTRHNVTRVKFTVYVKDGKAALKASPVK